MQIRKGPGAQRPQSARKHSEAEPRANGRVALSARNHEKRPWAAGGGVDAVLSALTPHGDGRFSPAHSPVRPMPVLTPRTPRHQKAIQEAKSGNTPPASPRFLQVGAIDSAMACIIHEELYRAKDYPDTAHITPSLVPGKSSQKYSPLSVFL